MATTAAGTPYVESSDLVANYPGVSLALANHIDTLGKVLQVVRATDTTNRATTSTSFVDATGMTVTITPSHVDNTVILIATGYLLVNGDSGTGSRAILQITNASNTEVSGAQGMTIGTYRYSYGTSPILDQSLFLMGQASPATVSAVTYKLRWKVQESGNLTELVNNSNTGQMFAIEVAA